MIGLDTNVLVRYLVADDTEQVTAVDSLVAKARDRNEPFYVDTIVLCETVWVLRSSYGYSRQQIHGALELVFRLFQVGDADLLPSVLSSYREAKGDLADYLIGERNLRAGCSHTATFDRALGQAPGFELLRL